MTARSFLWLRSCSSSQPSLSELQFCCDFQEKGIYGGCAIQEGQGPRDAAWFAGRAKLQGPREGTPSNDLCSSQRGNVDGLATTGNRLLSPERYLLTTLTANGLHTKRERLVVWMIQFSCVLRFLSRRVLVCAICQEDPRVGGGGGAK
jgi:hypothetical protein